MARKLIVEIIGDSSSLEKSFKRTSVGANKFEKDLGRTVRGSAAASGAFKSLGRSLAFASGGFIAGASVTGFLKNSITQAEQAAVAQKQLAAQFKASGQDLGVYQRQIDKTVSRLSNLAGIEDDQVKQAFTLAFRATKDVNEGLRITAIAADVAKGRHIELSAATIALNKAFLGQTTALKRLGIVVPKNLTGLQALEFVSRRFAGQAQAGTTTQERFTAAFVNFEQVVGTALLPTFDKYLKHLTRWLNDSKHQKTVQDDLSTGVGALGDLWTIAAAGVKKYNQETAKINNLPGPLKEALKVLFAPGFGLKRLAQAVSGGFGPKVTAPTGVKGPVGQSGPLFGLTGPLGSAAIPTGGTSAPGRLGFNARLVKLQIALAKAELTQSQRDDRAVLVQTAALVRQRLARVKTLKDKLALSQQLSSINQQITQIDQTQAQNEKDAAQKIKDARQKALDAAKKRVEKEKAQDAKELSILKAREDRLKNQIKAIQGRFQSQLDAARQGIGDLFAGPVKADVNEAARRTLGLHTAATGIGALTSNLRAQTNQAAAFQRDINTLIKRGAPNELIKELRAAGVAGAGTQAHTLATATASALKAFLTEFGKREKLALTTTQTIMKAQTVTLTADKIKLEGVKHEITLHNHVDISGQRVSDTVTKHQVRAQRRTAAQKTGRIAGLGPVVG